MPTGVVPDQEPRPVPPVDLPQELPGQQAAPVGQSTTKRGIMLLVSPRGRPWRASAFGSRSVVRPTALAAASALGGPGVQTQPRQHVPPALIPEHQHPAGVPPSQVHPSGPALPFSQRMDRSVRPGACASSSMQQPTGRGDGPGRSARGSGGESGHARGGTPQVRKGRGTESLRSSCASGRARIGGMKPPTLARPLQVEILLPRTSVELVLGFRQHLPQVLRLVRAELLDRVRETSFELAEPRLSRVLGGSRRGGRIHIPRRLGRKR